MNRNLFAVLLGLLSLVALAVVSPSQAAEGTVAAMSPWSATGEIFRVAPDRLQFQGKFEGILYVEKVEWQLDTALLLCPGTQTVELSTGNTQGNGYCMITGAKGDQVFAEWSCSGTAGKGCVGEMTLTGGTGAYAGISGSGQMATRTVLSQLTADLGSGEVVSHAAGLAVWPELRWRIPER